jgi:hypothetical protein
MRLGTAGSPAEAALAAWLPIRSDTNSGKVLAIPRIVLSPSTGGSGRTMQTASGMNAGMVVTKVCYLDGSFYRKDSSPVPQWSETEEMKYRQPRPARIPRRDNC